MKLKMNKQKLIDIYYNSTIINIVKTKRIFSLKHKENPRTRSPGIFAFMIYRVYCRKISYDYKMNKLKLIDIYYK